MANYTTNDIKCDLSSRKVCPYRGQGRQCLNLGRDLHKNYSTCDFRLWHTFKGIYLIRRGGSKAIFGTFLALLRAIHEYVLCHIAMMFLLPIGSIKNGYALTLLSPFLLAYYAVFSIIIIAVAIFISLFYPPVAIWTILFELPASVLNNDF